MKQKEEELADELNKLIDEYRQRNADRFYLNKLVDEHDLLQIVRITKCQTVTYIFYLMISMPYVSQLKLITYTLLRYYA